MTMERLLRDRPPHTCPRCGVVVVRCWMNHKLKGLKGVRVRALGCWNAKLRC